MPEEARYHYISSAVVAVMPGHIAEVAQAIGGMGGPEIRACGNGRIIVVIEGSSGGELSDRLTEIGNLEGVIAANMVFEHIEELRGAEA